MKDCPNGEDEGDIFECDIKWTQNGCCKEIIFIFGKNRYECEFERNQGDFVATNSDFDAFMESLNLSCFNNNFQWPTPAI